MGANPPPPFAEDRVNIVNSLCETLAIEKQKMMCSHVAQGRNIYIGSIIHIPYISGLGDKLGIYGGGLCFPWDQTSTQS